MDARPRLELSPEAVPAIRASMKFETIEDPLERGVERREIKLERPNDDGTLRCLMYTPLERATPMPAYLHIHGGGYLIGAPEMSDPMNVLVASKLGCIVLSVDYRPSPRTPCPVRHRRLLSQSRLAARRSRASGRRYRAYSRRRRERRRRHGRVARLEGSGR